MKQHSQFVVRRFVPILSAAVLSGCMVGPDYHGPTTQVSSDRFAATQASTTQPTQVDLARWWTTFNDPTLNKLIDRAVVSNLDVRLAQSRVREARAQLEYNRGALFPTLDGNASYTRTRPSHNSSTGVSAGTTSGSTGTTTTGGTTGTGTSTGTTGSTGGTANSGTSNFSLGESDLFQTGFDAGWEIDVFGGTRRAIESSESTLEAQIETRRNTLVTLLGEVAQNYVSLRGYQHTFAIVQRNISSQNDTVELQRTKLRAGLATDLTVAQAEALLASTEAQIPTLQTQIQQAIHRLSILLDQEPSALEDELLIDSPLPQGPAAIPPGLPSELLRRRPDVRAAERNIEAATAAIGVATADLFPKFSLNGSIGLSSAKWTNLPNNGSVFYSIGPNVSWRLFDAGQILANIHTQDALEEQAILTYRQTVLQALSEVEDALTAYDREQARDAALRRSVDASRRALDLAKQLNDAGVVDFLNVLTAQQTLFQAQNDLSVSDQTVATNLVALYKSLGGGWETTDAQSEPTQDVSHQEAH